MLTDLLTRIADALKRAATMGSRMLRKNTATNSQAELAEAWGLPGKKLKHAQKHEYLSHHVYTTQEPPLVAVKRTVSSPQTLSFFREQDGWTCDNPYMDADPRTHPALQELPDKFTKFWCISDWLVAAGDTEPHPGLITLANIAHILPSKHTPWDELIRVDTDDNNAQNITPPLPQPPAIKLPTRYQHEQRGSITPTGLGADEVDAIAEKLEQPNVSDFAGTRIIRNLPNTSVIFEDATEKADSATTMKETND
jgi:hypothetical protein